jgi:protein ImuB
VDRLACVDVPALPLQLLLARHAEWSAAPVAVVDRDKPNGVVLHVNARARALGVTPGLRYSAALALAGDLRAGAAEPPAIAACVDALTERLRRFSPGVEPCADEPGVFWLDASGLERLYASLDAWARAVRGDLRAAGFRTAAAVGWDRFGTYACAKARPRAGVVVLASRDDEIEAARRVPMARIAEGAGLDAGVRAMLQQLAVRTVGDFLRLPPGGILRRFGDAAHRLHRLGQFAENARHAQLQPRAPEEPLASRVELDDPESDFERLTFLVKPELDALLARLSERGQALCELSLTFSITKHPPVEERIRPAAPTLDGVQLLGLVRLRLEALKFPAGVTGLETRAEGVRATADQLRLFAQKPRRDLAAAARALARVRAALGDTAVVHARLRDGHLPEARFTWEPMDSVPPAAPTRSDRSDPSRHQIQATLVRRVEPKPRPLPPRPAREPDGWLLDDPREGPVERLSGPHRLSGGWWQGEVDRDYYFAEVRSGALYWIFYDRRRRRWFMQGEVT